MQNPSHNQGMALAKRKSHHRLIVFFAMSAIALIMLESHAQSEEEICPCFSMEELESIFLIEVDLPDEERNSHCSTEDFKVECSAEVVVMDQDYEVIAQAGVDWLDFDPGGGKYGESVALYRAISQRPAEEMAENVAAHRADGRMVASDRPGLGVELNMDALGDAVAEYTV
jgi:hypothetical protein